MAFEPVNLAQIYQAVDAGRANELNARNAQRQARMDDLQLQRYQQQESDRIAQRDAYRGAIGEDGSLDEKTLLSNLYRVAPEKALEAQQGFAQRDAAAQKLRLESQKADLENKKATAAYLRDRAATVGDENSYQNFLEEGRQLGAGFVNNAPQAYDPNWVKSQVMTADQFLQRMTPKYERVDLGGKIQVIDVNPETNPSIRGTALEKTLTPDAIASDRRMREEGALNRGVTLRGQDMSAATSRRGQDLTASTAEANRTKPAKSGLSSAAQKELFEADEIAQSSQNALGMLKEALTLNKQAYSGVGAKQRAVVRSNLPGDSAAADATINLDNLMTGQALESLKATFGGMPTEGERKILLDIQASADKTPAQREAILKRAVQAAQKRLKFSQSKSQALRSGTYFTDGVPLVESAPQAETGIVDFGSLK